MVTRAAEKAARSSPRHTTTRRTHSSGVVPQGVLLRCSRWRCGRRCWTACPAAPSFFAWRRLVHFQGRGAKGGLVAPSSAHKVGRFVAPQHNNQGVRLNAGAAWRVAAQRRQRCPTDEISPNERRRCAGRRALRVGWRPMRPFTYVGWRGGPRQAAPHQVPIRRGVGGGGGPQRPSPLLEGG